MGIEAILDISKGSFLWGTVPMIGKGTMAMGVDAVSPEHG